MAAGCKWSDFKSDQADVACPICNARPGQSCRNAFTSRAMPQPHLTRHFDAISNREGDNFPVSNRTSGVRDKMSVTSEGL